MWKHLASIASTLRKGGLYIVENYRLGWTYEEAIHPQRWEMEWGGVRVKTTYEPRLKDAESRTLVERITMEVEEKGKRRVITDESETVIIPGEELTGLLEGNELKVIGWFDHETGEPLVGSNNFNYLVIRRK
jgi:hypothetical protein